MDGSLYATILKSPKSPIKSPTYPFITNNNNTGHEPSSPVKTQRTSTHNLISPPPEFSNKKLIEVQERYTTINGSPYPTQKTPPGNTIHREHREVVKSHSFTPTPSYEEIRIPSRSSSRDVTLRSQSYSHQTTPRPSSSLSSTNYHQPEVQPRSSSVVRAASYTPSNYSGASHQLRSIDNYHYNTVQNGSSSRSQTVSYQEGRESVRSPLTLSMDSGISSSGIANSKYFYTYYVLQEKLRFYK